MTIDEALSLALREHQAGRLQAAEQIYRQILAADSNCAQAWHLLGVVAHQAGQHGDAIECIGRAIELNGIELNGDDATVHYNLGVAYQALELFPAAIASYQRALELRPNYAQALDGLGNSSYGVGRMDEAVDWYQRLIELEPRNADAHYNLGNALISQGRLDAAITSYRRSTELRPEFAAVYSRLANALKDRGQVDEAIACCQRALELQPGCAIAHNNLGVALCTQGRFTEATACYRRALEIAPDYAEAHHNLGIALQAQGKIPEAVFSYEQALQLRPENADAYNNLGGALHIQDKTSEAVCCYQRALMLNPDHIQAQTNLGSALREQERIDEAAACYHAALRSGRNQPLDELRLASLCPAVFESSQAIDDYRHQLLREIERISASNPMANAEELGIPGGEPPFNLMYHGRDDRPLKEAWAKVYGQMVLSKGVRPGTERPKVGIVVTRKHEGVFVKFSRGILERFSSAMFELVVICQATGATRIREAARSDSIGVLTIPERFDFAVETIRQARFDVLHHWEVGSDSVNYCLPFFGLAPVQCTSGGMQVTSGIPLMDYYLSNNQIEPAGAQAHYTEKLILAKTFLT